MDWHRIGRTVRALRHQRRWTQAELAGRARCSRSVISRVESAVPNAATAARLSRIVEALGARLVVSIAWRGGELDRLLDADHAALGRRWDELRRASGRPWEVRQEVTYNHYGDRGSIDDLAWDPLTGVLVVAELKTGIYDAQRTVAKIDEKQRLAGSTARRFGWSATRVVPALVVADTRTNRRRVAAASAVLARFECRGPSAKRWLRDPRTDVSGLLLFVSLSDVRGMNARQAGRQRVRRRSRSASVTAADEPGE